MAASISSRAKLVQLGKALVEYAHQKKFTQVRDILNKLTTTHTYPSTVSSTSTSTQQQQQQQQQQTVTRRIVNTKDKGGRTALHWVCVCKEGGQGLVNRLLKMGADPNIQVRNFVVQLIMSRYSVCICVLCAVL